MYKLSYFTEEDPEKVLTFMRENPFAIIAGRNDKYPVATHLPLHINVEENVITLTGHMMKNTDHHKAYMKDENVLVIFNGPHCHVSASWYVNPAQGSTWNYMTVHAKGKISFKDEADTRSIVEAITNKYEPAGGPAAFGNLPHEYVNRLVKAIAGFTVTVESVDNVFKLSQNHEPETRNNIIKHLHEKSGHDENKIAAEMQVRLNIAKNTL